MKKKSVYRITYTSHDSTCEIYAKRIKQGELYGFIEIEDLIFGEASSIVVDPTEERLKTEFNGVKRILLPMHLVLRIDVVEKEGIAKVLSRGHNNSVVNINQFPTANFSPKIFPYNPEKPSK